nr:MAG TPA: hypothetical protein [Caudoviricetes sp.]
MYHDTDLLFDLAVCAAWWICLIHVFKASEGRRRNGH